MEQITKLQEEIKELRRILLAKEQELKIIANKFSIKLNDGYMEVDSGISVSEQHNAFPPTLVPGADERNNAAFDVTECDSETKKNQQKGTTQIGDSLPRWAIERYSRQILLSEIGVDGQERLCAAKVLIVGAGGLGCPSGVYLAGAGIGEIGIVDYDTVELTNIHRQFLHTEEDQFFSKAESAANSLRKINSRIKVTAHKVQLCSQNALKIASHYDVVLDCTDNVPTRYLLNDLCVLSKIPLISGSALKMEGQLTVYGYREKNNSHEKECYVGPCYRCVFPSPPPPAAVGSCSAQGVAGPVPGAIGCLQALEAIKYLVGSPRSKLLVERMLLFDGDDMTFRTVKLRPKSEQCAACSDNATISQLIDYELFCNAQAKEKKKQDLKSEIRKREKEKRMTGKSYYGFRTNETKKWIQDVPKSERKIGPSCKSEICSKGTQKKCSFFTEDIRNEIFHKFWNNYDWREKKNFVRSSVETVPVKRRRVKVKGVFSRKGGSKLYHLVYGDDRYPVCRVMFLNTLGVKEAMIRHWLTNEDRPKVPKQPIKAINVHNYLDNLPKTPPKCPHCINNGTKINYINIQNIKNLFQLYNLYTQEMKSKKSVAASRKTFSKVASLKNVRIFKAKNLTDICDIVKEHNSLQSLNYDNAYYYDGAYILFDFVYLLYFLFFNNPNFFKDLELHILPPKHRITPLELAERLTTEQRHLLVDVRSEAEFNMCKIDGSTNYPIEKLFGDNFERLLGEIRNGDKQVTFICRRGNDSQEAAQKVLEAIEKEHHNKIRDMSGGLHAWSNDVDSKFPIY